MSRNTKAFVKGVKVSDRHGAGEWTAERLSSLILIPLTLGGIFMYRGTGLRDLLRQCNQILSDAKGISDVGSCTVIPFNEASKVLGTAPVSYFCGAVFAATVDFFRSLNVLL